ncbi:hypothetical protein [Pasteuria penetrans]|nr:hypothetical protein [Pasteuria penetrans]
MRDSAEMPGLLDGKKYKGGSSTYEEGTGVLFAHWHTDGTIRAA